MTNTRLLDIYNLLLKRRYVTVPEVVSELQMDRGWARDMLCRLAKKYPALVIEEDALPGRGAHGITAYYFPKSYKRQLIEEQID